MGSTGVETRADPSAGAEKGAPVAAPDPSSTHRGGVIYFVWAFVGVALMIGAWSFATPLGAGPDEPNHMAQAAAIVRGQFAEPLHPSAVGEIAAVDIPRYVWRVGFGPNCFAFRPQVSAACARPIGDSTAEVLASTQFSNAPPLYYLVTGVPTLLWSGSGALYAMRVVSGLVNAALVALGMFLLLRYHPRRAPMLGTLVALTPMALFIMAVVNSSGLELAAGFATWCGWLCVIEYPTVPRALAAGTAIATVLLILARPTSPLDALIVAVVLGVLVGWRGLRTRFDRSTRPLWISGVAALVAAGVVLLIFGRPHLLGIPGAHRQSLASNMWATLRQTGDRFRQTVGEFGWLDTPVHAWVVAVWASALGLLTAVAVVLSRPCRRALPLLAVLAVAMPLVLESPQINTVGLFWQGRYWLPVLVGFPLVASSFHGASARRMQPVVRWGGVGAIVVGAGLAAAQIASFRLNLRRYESGLGPHAPATARWAPPGGEAATVVFVAGVAVTLALVLVAMLRRVDVSGG
jgi:hypothetical protein